MNDQRPTRWPCSADSSRNAGPAPRSFRKAETGVSQSSMNVWQTGMRLCSPASARASSTPGVTSRLSAATGKQDPLAREGRVSEQLGRVGAVRIPAGGALGDRPLERGERLLLGERRVASKE